VGSLGIASYVPDADILDNHIGQLGAHRDICRERQGFSLALGLPQFLQVGEHLVTEQ